ncbi:ABC transporter ATP-binding protein [Aureispira anguillae]|uniref:ABC transporter ATP-binding protein/permease n=1 Tax=Aureispira anguillae TaxID=2864201 RepID=A0A916DWY5_9BACT|nr:ABC transporter ATP-binding protein [Aureispira anguillae]BDS14501.1 ABC transporter ATP-binding protein/permease [Aureispira anguillae]
MKTNTLTDQQFSSKRALLPFLKRIGGYAWQYPKWVLGLLFWVMIVAVADALFPLLLKVMIDDAITPQLEALKLAQDQGTNYVLDFSLIYYYTGIFILIGLIQAIGVYLFIRYAGRIQEYVMHDLRKAMFERLQKLSFSFYDRSASGWLLTRLTSDTDRVAEVISWGLLEAFWGISMISFCLVVLFIYSWKLGLIVALSIPFMLVVSVKIRLLVLQYSRASRKINSELTATFSEHINGIVVNKSTAQEARVSQEFQALSGRMHHASYRASYYTAMYIPVVILTGSFAAAFVVYFGGKMTLAIPAIITVGTLIAAIDYATKIFIPIVDISMFYARAQGSLSAGERIFSLIDEPISIQDQAGATAFGAIKGAIRFEQVDFYYNPEHPVLENFNLQINAGQSIALVGATGEGKSTIANLVARFYEPQNGCIKIDGEDYQQKTIHSLRSQLGMVLQTPHLFIGSIRDNIRYAKKEATDTEIIAALELVGATQFINRLDEAVGEEGENLSMGEKQLLSFARAILPNPKIIIMDEATSSIDTITEAKIQQSIHKMLQNRTAIIIAHRLSTIKNCDRILVIQKGKIIEDGSHSDLMKQGGKYHSLYTKQLSAERILN